MPTPILTAVGWRERVDLPDWGIVGLVAKIDTGAKTSAIHVENLATVEPGIIGFDVVLSRKSSGAVAQVRTAYLKESKVKSSSGHITHRYVVETRMRMKGVEKTIQLGLVSRPHMIRRMLVGRQALIGAFIVDPSLPFIK